MDVNLGISKKKGLSYIIKPNSVLENVLLTHNSCDDKNP